MIGRLIAAVVVCGLPCACTTDRTGDTAPQRMVTRQIRIEAAASETRTQLAPDGYNVQWSPGDRIGVYVESGGTFTTANAPLTFEGAEAAASGMFSGEITLTEGASSYTLYAYYPYSADSESSASGVPFTLATQQAQSTAGDSSHLGDYDFLVAGAVTSTTGDFGPLTFSHAFAVVEVDLTGSGTMAGKRVGSVMLFGTDAATVSLSGTVSGTANMTGRFSFDLTSSSPATAS